MNAKRYYYGFQFRPAFGKDWLDIVWAEGKVASIEAVYDELVDYGDQLSDWRAITDPSSSPPGLPRLP